MLTQVKEITYRGFLKSCNYTCHYCPFGKRTMTGRELETDERLMERFLSRLFQIQFVQPVSVLLAPYGEGLIHPHYQHAIARLSRHPLVRQVGCQSNGSFSLSQWSKVLEQQAQTEKIALWLTYHPQMTEAEAFVEKVLMLAKSVRLSVGVVGDPDRFGEIQRLRRLLPSWIYLWINGLDGLGRAYTEVEMARFLAIDPEFKWEINRMKSRACNVGDHCFVLADGSMYPCNRFKQVIGNFYEELSSLEWVACSTKCCDCYLAYSHRPEFMASSVMGQGSHVRVPWSPWDQSLS